MSYFLIAVNFVLSNEGGLEEDSNDPGGITNFGISLRFLKSTNNLKYDFNGDGLIDEREIKDLTQENAIIVYQNEFWNVAHFDKILNQSLCNYLFDMSVNMGLATAIKITQQALCAFNKNRNFITIDGILGSNTLDEINHVGSMLLPALISERTNNYRMQVALNPDKKEFLNDWLNRSFKF
jgi:lysozyme family protein